MGTGGAGLELVERHLAHSRGHLMRQGIIFVFPKKNLYSLTKLCRSLT
jgi:hypothetical protein